MLKKIGLYILSLWLLFFLIILVTMDIPICFEEGCKFIGIKQLVITNITPVVCVALLFTGWLSYRYFKYELKGTARISFRITKIKSINYEHLTFLATYVIPLICFNFENSRYIVVLFVLLIVMGAIYIKTDLFYANPSLALLGYQIYEVDGQFKNTEKSSIILITRDKLGQDDRVKYIKLDERIFYAKKA